MLRDIGETFLTFSLDIMFLRQNSVIQTNITTIIVFHYRERMFSWANLFLYFGVLKTT